VEFTFYAGHGIPYSGIAVCSVEEGPDYEIPIVGNSSFITFDLSTYEIDFGEVAYNEQVPREFEILNNGAVPFEFSINLSSISRPGLIECHPMAGKVLAGDKTRVQVKFFAGVPDNISEMFLVECAHFPAKRFKVKAVGTYPGCLLSFPRTDDEDFNKRYEETKRLLQKGKVNYQALYQSPDALKQQKSERDKSPSSFVMDVEAETDRRHLCEKILQQLDMGTAKQAIQTGFAPAA